MKVDTDALRRAADIRLAAAKAEYEAEIKHIESIEAIAKRIDGEIALRPELPGPGSSNDVGFKNKSTDPSWRGFRQAILKFALGRTEGFSTDDVKAFIEMHYPGAAERLNLRKTSTHLSAMYSRTKELERIVHGSGSLPGIYVLTEKGKKSAQSAS